MAKIKISELASELNREPKEVYTYLQSQGIAAKRSNSSVEQEDADIARRYFSAPGPSKAEGTETKAEGVKPSPEKAAAGDPSTGSGTAKKVPAAEKAPSEKPSPSATQAAPAKVDAGTAKKAPAPGAPVKKAPQKQGGGDDAPKKKKKIIFVSNPGNSKIGGVKASPQDPRKGKAQPARSGGRSGFSVSQNAYHPIKPLTAPSQPDAYQNVSIKPSEPAKPEAPRKEAPKPEAAPAPAPAAKAKEKEAVPAEPVKAAVVEAPKKEAKAPAAKILQPRDDRPKETKETKEAPRKPAKRQAEAPRPGQQDSDRSQGGRGGKRGFKGDRDSQRGKGEQKETDKRKLQQEKDRRKKGARFEDEENMPRSRRVGRFIKPEVKKEEPEEQIKVIQVPEKITIKELGEKMKTPAGTIIKKLFLEGKMVTLNSELSYEEAEAIAIEYDIICEKEIPVDIIEELLKEEDDAPETLKKRPPVVVVMGHVDHGKTSLLDAIRKTNVIDREAGGITQKIGAYTAKVNGQSITFLDTPGHEAFTAMRMRGANSTDIAVLVVAADDGVMPQTVEAINHARAAEVEIVVAVNKIDKAGANIDRVKQELTEHGLIATDWGGQTEFVPVSAKSGEGIESLLETIILTADILELKANPDRQARGLVLEAQLDKGRGPVANVLVQKGTLHIGDFISAGACSGKVRAMVDDKGKRVKEAYPSQPVEILGLSDVPNAGEILVGHDNDKEAKQYAATYLEQHKHELIEETKAKMSLDDLYSKIEEGKLKELNIIIKADVQGSAEALKQSLLKLSNDEVVVKIIHSGVGAITESDVTLAATSSAIIIGFDVRPDMTAKSISEREGVEIKLYSVIYQAIDDVEAAMKGMLAPVYEERVIGHAEVRQIFKASAIGNIAGAMVLDGSIQKGCQVRINRGDEMIFEGALKSLKRFKDDVKDVREGFECGLVFDGFDKMEVGDTVEAFTMVEVPRE